MKNSDKNERRSGRRNRCRESIEWDATKNLSLLTTQWGQPINCAAFIVRDQQRAVVGRLDVNRSPPVGLRLIVEPSRYKINLWSWPPILPREKDYLVSRLAASIPGSVQRERDPIAERIRNFAVLQKSHSERC